MTSADLLADAFGRIREEVHNAVDGLSKQQLAFRVDDDANSIAWLVWHLTRIQDDHMSGVTGAAQVWTSRGWAERFGLPFGRLATGYEHSSSEVAAVQVDAELLTGYHDAVFEETSRYVRTLTDADLPRIVDESWDPPVTLAVRLISVIADDLEHAGQAAFIRGLLLRR
ncbi:MAG TPA: DUF664 domain-containing protein [Streptosporangiaceae bacterium]|jgi:uncharacterized damage-inducible protein DinB|nr:DUF664 domain-containing protein [Streptosporangiaceae bacterium]